MCVFSHMCVHEYYNHVHVSCMCMYCYSLILVCAGCLARVRHYWTNVKMTFNSSRYAKTID